MFGLYIGAFAVSFLASAVFKLKYKPAALRRYTVRRRDDLGTILRDLPYGNGEAQKFDLYLPAGEEKESYGLVVYLHAGGFTGGDKKEDTKMLQWLCSKGYVAAGINYTLCSDTNPGASVYTQSLEIRDSIPFVLEEARRQGYPIDAMAVSGGSAGGCLALLYAYRDGSISPVPVKLVFEAVGPSCFYPEDWKCFGFDRAPETGLALFSRMAGRTISPELLGTPAYDDAIRDISAALWVTEDSAPAVLAYGTLDKVQSFEASLRLDAALTRCHIPHEYIVCPHSGHGLQNDSALYARYLASTEDYLARYLPVK